MRLKKTKLLIGVGVFGTVLLAVMFHGLLNPSRRYLARKYWNDVVPIAFYGKVTDQRGAPIKDATIEIVITTFDKHFLIGGRDGLKEYHVSLVTGQDGKFSVGGVEGMSIYIQTISREGFATISSKVWPGSDGATTSSIEWRRYDDLQKSLHYYYSPSYGPPLVYAPDPETPAVFPLVKEGEQTTRYPSRGGVAWKGPPKDEKDRTSLLVIVAVVVLAVAWALIWAKHRGQRRFQPAGGGLIQPPRLSDAPKPLEYQAKAAPVARGISGTRWELDGIGKAVLFFVLAALMLICVLYVMDKTSPPHQMGP